MRGLVLLLENHNVNNERNSAKETLGLAFNRRCKLHVVYDLSLTEHANASYTCARKPNHETFEL